jgi:hypothetical protein
MSIILLVEYFMMEILKFAMRIILNVVCNL